MFRTLLLCAFSSLLIYPMNAQEFFAIHIENGLECLVQVKINDATATYLLNKIFVPNECFKIDLLVQDISIDIEYFSEGQFKYLDNKRLKRDKMPSLYHLFIGD